MPVVCLTWYSLTKTDLHFLFYVHFSFSSFPLQYQHYWRFDESAVQSFERNWGYSGTFLELRGKIQVTTLSVPQKMCYRKARWINKIISMHFRSGEKSTTLCNTLFSTYFLRKECFFKQGFEGLCADNNILSSGLLICKNSSHP